MSMSADYRSLFAINNISSKLDLLQSLLDSKELTSAEALALLSAIHADLRRPKVHGSSTYMRYAEMTEGLRRQMPDTFEQVVQVWKDRRAETSASSAASPSVTAESMPTDSQLAPQEIWEEWVDPSRETSSRPEAGTQQASAEAQPVGEMLEPSEGQGESAAESEEPGEPEAESEETGSAEEKEVKDSPEEIEEPEQERPAQEGGKEESEQEREAVEGEEGQEEGKKEESEEPAESEAKETVAEESSREEITEEPEAELQETLEAREPEPEAESDPAEGERMATEAAEAAHESEHVEIELESPEEEPPLEAAE